MAVLKGFNGDIFGLKFLRGTIFCYIVQNRFIKGNEVK